MSGAGSLRRSLRVEGEVAIMGHGYTFTPTLDPLGTAGP
jgi:hypothetical protein